MLKYDFRLGNGPEVLRQLNADSLVSSDELASIFLVSGLTIRNWREKGGLKAIRIGRKCIRFRWGDVVD